MNNKVLGTTKDNINIFFHEEFSHPHREDLITETIGKIEIKDRGYIRETIDLGRIIGKNHLVDIDEYDTTIMWTRPKHQGPSKMVLSKQAPATSKVTIIICQNQNQDEDFGKYFLITLFEGEAGLPEPWNKGIQNDPIALAKSKDFWRWHALVPTDKERELILKENNIPRYTIISYDNIHYETDGTMYNRYCSYNTRVDALDALSQLNAKACKGPWGWFIVDNHTGDKID